MREYTHVNAYRYMYTCIFVYKNISYLHLHVYTSACIQKGIQVRIYTHYIYLHSGLILHYTYSNLHYTNCTLHKRLNVASVRRLTTCRARP